MRTKLFILLALFVAFSTASFAQTATETQGVTLGLTEIRNLTLTGGAITVPIKRSALGVTKYVNSTAGLTFNHDLTVNQKIVVSAALTGTVGNWVDRSLSIGASDQAVPVAYWTAIGPIATASLIIDGIVEAPKTFIGNLPQNQIGLATGPLILHYEGSAGLTALIGDAAADVTYNITDM